MIEVHRVNPEDPDLTVEKVEELGERLIPPRLFEKYGIKETVREPEWRRPLASIIYAESVEVFDRIADELGYEATWKKVESAGEAAATPAPAGRAATRF